MPTESLPVARQRNVRAQWLNSSCRKTEKIEIEWSRPRRAVRIRRDPPWRGKEFLLTRRECIGIRCCIIVIALEQSVLEQSAVERSALEQSVLEQSAMVHRAEISLTFQCRVTALLYITIFPVCRVTL